MAETNQEKHEETYALAESALRERDPAQIAQFAGGVWRPEPEGGVLELASLGADIALRWPGLEFQAPEGLLGSFPWRLLTLHYLLAAGPEDPGEDWIGYRELPDGLFYANTVTREVEMPLAARYGADPEAFLAAGRSLGGEAADLADRSFVLRPFPKVPVVFALWEEDEEFPAKAKVLYERTGARYLPLQDLRIVAELMGQALLSPGGGAHG